MQSSTPTGPGPVVTCFRWLGFLARLVFVVASIAYIVMTGEVWYPGKPAPAAEPHGEYRPPRRATFGPVSGTSLPASDRGVAER